MSENHPLVSVVVTTKNEENNIRNCLESINAQTWSNLEAIVVDNNSTDNTQAIAREYTPNVFSKGPERSAQRNYGMINKAQGEYVIYIDVDMMLSPILIESCVYYIKQTCAVALHVPEIVLGKSYLSQVRRFERNFYDGTPIDGARFFRRSIFIDVGGFDESIFTKGSGEDWDIDKLMKQHGLIKLLPRFNSRIQSSNWSLTNFIEDRGVQHDNYYSGIYHDESEFKLYNYLKKKSYYCLGFYGYIKKWGRDDADIHYQFSFLYRFWIVFTEHGKWRRLLLRPHLTAGLYFLRICVGLVYVWKKLGSLSKTMPS